jgi:hypothetical protein
MVKVDKCHFGFEEVFPFRVLEVELFVFGPCLKTKVAASTLIGRVLTFGEIPFHNELI